MEQETANKMQTRRRDENVKFEILKNSMQEGKAFNVGQEKMKVERVNHKMKIKFWMKILIFMGLFLGSFSMESELKDLKVSQLPCIHDKAYLEIKDIVIYLDDWEEFNNLLMEMEDKISNFDVIVNYFIDSPMVLQSAFLRLQNHFDDPGPFVVLLRILFKNANNTQLMRIIRSQENENETLLNKISQLPNSANLSNLILNAFKNKDDLVQYIKKSIISEKDYESLQDMANALRHKFGENQKYILYLILTDESNDSENMLHQLLSSSTPQYVYIFRPWVEEFNQATITKIGLSVDKHTKNKKTLYDRLLLYVWDYFMHPPEQIDDGEENDVAEAFSSYLRQLHDFFNIESPIRKLLEKRKTYASYKNLKI